MVEDKNFSTLITTEHPDIHRAIENPLVDDETEFDIITEEEVVNQLDKWGAAKVENKKKGYIA